MAGRPSAPDARALAGQAQSFSRSGKAKASPAGQGSVLRKIGYILLSRCKMTFAADPQVDQPYPLGEVSYAIVVSENSRLEPDAAHRRGTFVGCNATAPLERLFLLVGLGIGFAEIGQEYVQHAVLVCFSMVRQVATKASQAWLFFDENDVGGSFLPIASGERSSSSRDSAACMAA